MLILMKMLAIPPKLRFGFRRSPIFKVQLSLTTVPTQTVDVYYFRFSLFCCVYYSTSTSQSSLLLGSVRYMKMRQKIFDTYVEKDVTEFEICVSNFDKLGNSWNAICISGHPEIDIWINIFLTSLSIRSVNS